MEYKGTLIAVNDMEKAKQFYNSVLGLEVVMDAGVNVQLTGGIFLQTADTWVSFIHKSASDIVFENNAVELYFETDDMDDFIKKLGVFTNISYIHPVVEHSWGQRAIRFYDLDSHIIEVAENIIMVIKRFIDSGLTVEQTAKRMDVDVAYTKAALEQLG
ncbi:MAG: VOC family protein [Eubacterium sp.]|nr:VOC family protein [Eubacterium sp.]